MHDSHMGCSADSKVLFMFLSASSAHDSHTGFSAASNKVSAAQTVHHLSALHVSPNQQVTKRTNSRCKHMELTDKHSMRSCLQPKTAVYTMQNQVLQRHGTDQ